jgi:hypothetical protein
MRVDMARKKGSRNKNPPTLVATLNLTLEERIQCLAILIADTLNLNQQTEAEIAKEFEDQ